MADDVVHGESWMLDRWETVTLSEDFGIYEYGSSDSLPPFEPEPAKPIERVRSLVCDDEYWCPMCGPSLAQCDCGYVWASPLDLSNTDAEAPLTEDERRYVEETFLSL
jgi:hypothetical protein